MRSPTRYWLLAMVVTLLAPVTARAEVSTFASGGSGPGQVKGPAGLTVAPNGDVYVADRNNSRIDEFSPAGQFVRAWGTYGDVHSQYIPADGEFNDPEDVAAAPNGDIYVADTNNNRIQQFDSSGNFIRRWGANGGDGSAMPAPGSFNNPRGVAVAPNGTVYVADTTNNRVQKFTADGTLISVFGTSGPGTLAWPFDVAVDKSGNVYVADLNNHRIAIFDAMDGFVGAIGTETLKNPIAVAIDRDSNLVVADFSLNQVVKLKPDGTGVVSFGSFGSGANQLSSPYGVAVVGSDVLVSDGGNSRIQRINTLRPIVQLTQPASPVLTGQAVVFDATGSQVPLAQVAGFAWDLDGDGSFETDTGTSGTATATYATRGVRTIQVRATAPSGQSETTSAQIDVRPAPPAGATGVSINNGAQFTNNPAVSLSAVWPTFALTALISNDGGFAGAQRVPVDALLPWTLDSSGPERLPKTVYVRFDDSTQTFQDDIILDQVPPTVDTATASDASASTARASATRTLRLSASDDNSGVEAMQFANDQSQPQAEQAYAASVTLAAAPPRFVRVRDRAGNYSAWRRIVVNRNVSFSLPKKKVKRGKQLVVRYFSPTDATLRVKVIRAQKLVLKQSFEIDKGAGSVRIPTKKLRPATYKLRLTLGRLTSTLSFKVTK